MWKSPRLPDGAHELAATSAGTSRRVRPRGRHATIPGAGHLAPLEAPEAFRSLLLEFLDGV